MSTLEGDVRPGDWCQIGRVLPRFSDWQPERLEPTPPLDPLTLAAKLTALAKQYDLDAREARQAAANCRAYASALRAGDG